MVQGQPQRIGQYEIRGILGSGGFATVYRAHDSVLERDVALKVLHPHLARDAGTRERFIREGRALARVKHPNVVTVYGAGEVDGQAYLATDLIEGRPLSDIIKERGPLTLPDLAAVIDQVAAALAAVHAQNLVHRDIKPDNVMIETATGRAVLLDLGVARDMSHATVATGFIVGTPGYMAPEQVQAGGQVTAQTDVYQLASTTYALLVGRPPFDGTTIQVLDAIVRYTPPDLRVFRPDIPPSVAAVIDGALAKELHARPQGTRAFARALREAAGLPQVPTPAPGIDSATLPVNQGNWTPSVNLGRQSAPKKNPLPVFAGGIAAVALLAGGIWWFSRDSGGPTPPPGTPTPEPIRAEQLYNALLGLPFSESELPSGFSKPKVYAGDMNDQSRNFGGIGEVDVEVAGPATSNFLWYVVFPTRAEAQKDFDKSSPGENATFKTTTNVSGLGDSAQCFDYVSNPGVDKFAGTFCQVLSDNVIVGSSLRAEGDVNDDRARSLHGQSNELAKSGLAHLNAVRADPRARTVPAPSATPRPSATPTRTPTPAPPTRTPSPTSTPITRTPQELYNALLSIAWQENETPRGISITRVYPGSMSDEFRSYRMVGNAIADATGTGNNDFIVHAVYQTAADAQAHFSGYGKGNDAQNSFTPGGFDVPAVCIRRAPASGQTAGRTFCAAQVDNVQVQGTSTVENRQSGNDDIAISLLRSGIQHLRRVQITR